jgi:choline kinase/phosphohistidine swiveling domain-containing protein
MSIDIRPESRVIILGAGKSVRGNLPPALTRVNADSCVLDWQIDSFSALTSYHINVVVGFKADQIQDKFPDIKFYFNPNWAITGPISSLRMVPLLSRNSTYVCYSDVVFRHNVIEEMEGHSDSIVLAIDTLWRSRYEGATIADVQSTEKVYLQGDRVTGIGNGHSGVEIEAQFAGLMKIPGELTTFFQDYIRSKNYSTSAKLSEVINDLIHEGMHVSFVDMVGDWAELDAPQDLARFALGTKAESLERLKPLLRVGRIGLQVSFTFKEWKENSKELIQQIHNSFDEQLLIVRSSSLQEDNWIQSSAGAFASIPNVPSYNRDAIREAVEKVFGSYSEILDGNQVLVQEMIQEVRLSGVVLTRVPSTGAPYYVINFDSESSRTDTVTSGEGKSVRTIYLHRNSELRPESPKELSHVMESVKDIESLVNYDSLDIEFAVEKGGSVVIFQVRPIAINHRTIPIDDEKISESIQEGICHLKSMQQPFPLLFGDSTYFSVMSDWNPAEMIGTKPGRLSFSLYRYLISDETWAEQRAAYGYRDVRPHNLIVDFVGHPYVDIRVDFNSFIPASLPDVLAEQLVNYYMDKLRRYPELHDKVEFDILFTCLTFDFDEQINELLDSGFSLQDVTLLKESLAEITLDGVKRCADDLENIQIMGARYRSVMSSTLPPLEKTYMLLQDVRRIGIPLFSHLARNAFVAVALLRSLVRTGRIKQDQLERFLASISTVGSDMQTDACLVGKNELDWGKFVEKYGHLRPSTYDITSVCYGNAADEFLKPMVSGSIKDLKRKEHYAWDNTTRDAIKHQLGRIGLEISVDEFFDFIKASIEGREMGKFIFTRNLNAALEEIATVGEQYNLSREQLAQLDIKDLLKFRSATVENMEQILQRLVWYGTEAYNISQAITLPGLIFSDTDFTCMEQYKAEPNFITQKKITASVVSLMSKTIKKMDLAGKIVVIPSADPGYDFLFSWNISGLITMYGGANSHMAIRAAEFQLPAAIGVGEILFEKINKARYLELDCKGRRIGFLNLGGDNQVTI